MQPQTIIHTLTYENGDKYVGQILNNMPHGKGVLTCADGNIYEGEWKDGEFCDIDHELDKEWSEALEGQQDDGNEQIAVLKRIEQRENEQFAQWKANAESKHDGRANTNIINVVNQQYNSETYTGTWDSSKNQPHGKGVLTLLNGYQYDGEWEDGKQHGRGVLTAADGSQYDGEWKDGKRHGKGVLTAANGHIIYDGEWKDGKQHGIGVITAADGSQYDGEWKDGKRHGVGVLTLLNGYRYDGMWEDGEQHGRGVLTLLNRNRLEGDFKYGNIQGFATKYIHNSNLVQQGIIVGGDIQVESRQQLNINNVPAAGQNHLQNVQGNNHSNHVTNLYNQQRNNDGQFERQ